ncbi:MAG: IclR family transcriptional regulator [Kiloniellales bacterium]
MSSSIINKTVLLLELLGNANRPQTFTEIVTDSGLNKSSVHRLLTLLQEHRLVQYEERARAYALGPKLLELARKARSGYDLQSVAFDEMQELYRRYQENVTLGILKSNTVAYVRTIEAYHDWSIVQAPGLREPFHSTATGKALVAFLPDKVRNALLQGYEFSRFTERTITNRSDFDAEMERVRRRGYAICDRENLDYVTGIASPIFNYVGEPIAALNIWAPAFRHQLDQLLEWVGDLQAACRRISEIIGSNQTGEDAFVIGQ